MNHCSFYSKVKNRFFLLAYVCIRVCS